MVPRFFVPRKIRGFSIFLERIDKMNLKEKQPKIYIICGKARHGKDTIAEMIRNYYLEKKYDVLNLQYSSYIKEYAKKLVIGMEVKRVNQENYYNN